MSGHDPINIQLESEFQQVINGDRKLTPVEKALRIIHKQINYNFRKNNQAHEFIEEKIQEHSIKLDIMDFKAKEIDHVHTDHNKLRVRVDEHLTSSKFEGRKILVGLFSAGGLAGLLIVFQLINIIVNGG